MAPKPAHYANLSSAQRLRTKTQQVKLAANAATLKDCWPKLTGLCGHLHIRLPFFSPEHNGDGDAIAAVRLNKAAWCGQLQFGTRRFVLWHNYIGPAKQKPDGLILAPIWVFFGSGRGFNGRGVPIGFICADFQLKRSRGDPFHAQNSRLCATGSNSGAPGS